MAKNLKFCLSGKILPNLVTLRIGSIHKIRWDN